jgi:hypothetical protein
MKKIKEILKVFDKILNWDFSDALKSQVKRAKNCYTNVNSIDELEVLDTQFGNLIELCKYYSESK